MWNWKIISFRFWFSGLFFQNCLQNPALPPCPLASPTIDVSGSVPSSQEVNLPRPADELLVSFLHVVVCLLIRAMGQSTIKWRKMKTWCYARQFCCCLADYERWVCFWAIRQEWIMLCPWCTLPQAASSELWFFLRTCEKSASTDVNRSCPCPWACLLLSFHNLKYMIVCRSQTGIILTCILLYW